MKLVALILTMMTANLASASDRDLGSLKLVERSFEIDEADCISGLRSTRNGCSVLSHRHETWRRVPSIRNASRASCRAEGLPLV